MLRAVSKGDVGVWSTQEGDISESDKEETSHCLLKQARKLKKVSVSGGILQSPTMVANITRKNHRTTNNRQGLPSQNIECCCFILKNTRRAIDLLVDSSNLNPTIVAKASPTVCLCYYDKQCYDVSMVLR
jgi:hypothetical protein